MGPGCVKTRFYTTKTQCGHLVPTKQSPPHWCEPDLRGLIVGEGQPTGVNLPMEMIARHLISLLTISLLSTAEAKAGAAPQQLQGKSITLSWSETGVFKRDGSSVSNTYNVVRVIYISEAGRAFIRGTTAGRGGGMTKEAGPERTAGRVDFQGNTVTVYQVNRGVARRAVVTIGPAFSNCSAAVDVGKSGPGATIGGYDGVTYEVVSLHPSAANCSIREGNALAN
jgi:hypothetical protein